MVKNNLVGVGVRYAPQNMGGSALALVSYYFSFVNLALVKPLFKVFKSSLKNIELGLWLWLGLDPR